MINFSNAIHIAYNFCFTFIDLRLFGITYCVNKRNISQRSMPVQGVSYILSFPDKNDRPPVGHCTDMNLPFRIPVACKCLTCQQDQSCHQRTQTIQPIHRAHCNLLRYSTITLTIYIVYYSIFTY